MRYEHIELDISTATCAVLEMLIEKHLPEEIFPGRTRDELINLANELRARLQRRDADPKCPKNFSTNEGWLDV